MSRTVPKAEPASHEAGVTLDWVKSLADFPASDWVLHYYLIPLFSGPANERITFDATADSNDHLVEVTAATTALWLPGRYTIVGQVTSGAQRFEVYRGEIEITPDLSSTDTTQHDGRSYARRMLEKVEKMIDEGIIRDVFRYTLAGVTQEVRSIDDALKARDYFRAEVALEDSGGKQRKILTRFRKER